jgi:hypothetical protein
MGQTEIHTTELEELVWDPKNAEQVADKLVAQSGLPGPRANLELAESFARAVSTASAEPAAWLETLYAWAGIGADEAPSGDPREFLPFCALISFGVLYNTHACAYPCTGPCDCPLWPIQMEYLVETIRQAASDPRWRIREAVVMALQHLGEGNPEALARIIDNWLQDASLTERRAAAAALAHPPLLEDEKFARFALKTADRILEDTAAVPEEKRKSEEFQILKQALGYALGVLVAHLPEEGFSLLERWTDSCDADIRWILLENLKEKHLHTADPERTARLRESLD